MSARYFNASARLLLTATGILTAALVLGAILSAALDAGTFPRRDVNAAQRPIFTRRMDVLPAIVVTPPATP